MKAALQMSDAYWPDKLVGQHELRSWLQEKGSLTLRLKKHYADFSVQPLSQGWQKPYVDERDILGIAAGEYAWVREVWLMGGGQPKVYAHSVVCRRSLRGPWHALRRIGQRPLGGVLFADAKVRRGDLHFKKLPQQHSLYKAIVSRLPQTQGQALWARRSLFLLKHDSLLVTEVFLPGFCSDINAQWVGT